MRHYSLNVLDKLEPSYSLGESFQALFSDEVIIPQQGAIEYSQGLDPPPNTLEFAAPMPPLRSTYKCRRRRTVTKQAEASHHLSFTPCRRSAPVKMRGEINCCIAEDHGLDECVEGLRDAPGVCKANEV